MRRPFALCLIALLLGCTSWRVTTRPLPDLVGNQQPDRLRVTPGVGARMVVHGPQVVGDTLAARVYRSGEKAAVHLPWRAIVTVERRRFDPGKTFLIVTGVAAIVTAAVFGALADHFAHGW
jgi:hypothetical protein